MKDFSIFFSIDSIIVFVLIFARMSGMLVTAPLFSTFPVPMQVKVGLSASCAFLMYPFVIQHCNFITPKDLVSLSMLMFKEVAVGVLIGFAISLIFTAIEIAGQLISVEMGLSMASALDPVTHQNVPIVGQLYLFMASLIFISINGHHYLFSTVYDSFRSIPMDMNFVFSSHITEQLLIFSSKIFLIAFSVIVPIYLILFIVTVLMGIVSKILPQMNVFMLAIPVKIYIGLSLMILLLTSTAAYISKIFGDLLINISGIFAL